MRRLLSSSPLLVSLALLGGCGGHGPIADDISAPMGAPVPFATPDQLVTFAVGEQVAQKRFSRAEGLGPGFNVTFCGACHEKPVFGGAAGLYRNFNLAGRRTTDGAFLPAESAGNGSGVVRHYQLEDGMAPYPSIDSSNTIVGGRNPIAFFGVGLLAELDEEEILKRADPDDEDGDGISGRPNYDRGFVGRFGVKAQTVSIEGFIRGPLQNHLGITTDPLTDMQKAALPVSSAALTAMRGPLRGSPVGDWVHGLGQVAAPDGPLLDEDDIPDPELSTDDLFALVSWAMLLAAPEVEELTDQGKRGQRLFDQAGCDSCHTPRLKGPRGNLPVYSDLLLHDMGPELDDGHPFGEATSSEFRTQPLWGIAAVGPYLHDGRATTITEAILMHGGEAEASRAAFAAYSPDEAADVVEFLLSLGGRSQATGGLLLPDEPVPPAGEYGGPAQTLSGPDAERFAAGRALFDFEFGLTDGAGGPRFNGDSCRACHFEPVIGGAGPRGVNVIRQGIITSDGEFAPPAVGTILHRFSSLPGQLNRPEDEVTHFESRQTPHLFGLGLIEGIDEQLILDAADPEDLDEDGISGRVSITDGGRTGRFGWKAQVPSIAEFVRDAVTAELGMTLPDQPGLTFGRTQDNDEVPDPEYSLEEAELLGFYLANLAGPPRQVPTDPELASQGEAIFGAVGCDRCHTPSLDGVPLFSDLLLHAILPEGATGMEDGSAAMEEFRTPPLWGLATTGPYLHDGRADTLDQAVRGHAGEATGVVEAYEELSEADRDALTAFLNTL